MTRAARRVAQVDRDTGKTIKVHPSVTSAALEMHGSHGNIASCARGVLPSAYGFVWVYIDGDRKPATLCSKCDEPRAQGQAYCIEHLTEYRQKRRSMWNPAPLKTRLASRLELIGRLDDAHSRALAAGDDKALRAVEAEYRGLGMLATAAEVGRERA